MNVTITPGAIRGMITVPPSKSLMQRACAASLLHTGTTHIHNAGFSDDEKAAQKIIEQLGARIQIQSDHSLKIVSRGVSPVSDVIDCGESGLSARLFTPVAALSERKITVTGHGTLLERPMNFFEDVFQQLKVKTISTNGRLPVELNGPLLPADIKIDGSLSSQFLTGLLFVYAFVARHKVTIEVANLVSKPYIDLTLDMLNEFGRNVSNDNYERFHIAPVKQDHSDIDINLEADWSSAAYWIVASILAGDITLKGLNNNSLQADRAILNVIKQAGGIFYFENDLLQVKRSAGLMSFKFDATDCPDLFPVLSIFAAHCNGTSSINGLNRLIHKESNRVKSITAMLDNFKVLYKIDNNSLQIEGVKMMKASTVDSYEDHRIAMAASIGALKAGGNITIRHAACVSKSYPSFFEHLGQLGISITSVV